MPLQVKSTVKSEFFYLNKVWLKQHPVHSPFIAVPWWLLSSLKFLSALKVSAAFLPFHSPCCLFVITDWVICSMAFQSQQVFFHKKNYPRICSEFRFILFSKMKQNFRKPCSAVLIMPVSICSSLLKVLLFLLFSTLYLKRFHQLLSNTLN